MKKYLIGVISIIVLLIGASLTADKKDEYVSITKISKLKSYNPNAVWKKVPCKHCNGTGSRTVQVYNAKANTMVKYLAPCYYCKGKGTKGMSKM